MPLRTDLPSALNLSRRAVTPVRLPRMTFPITGAPESGVGGMPLEGEEPMEPPVAMEGMVDPSTEYSAAAPPEPTTAAPGTTPQPTAGETQRVIVYGRSNCPACLEAVQDLVDREVSFTYTDVSRDPQALQHLTAICGGNPVVPVIVQIGVRGA